MPTPPFLLSTAQMRRLSPHFPLSPGIPRVITGGYSAVSSTSSGMVCSGAMRLVLTLETDPGGAQVFRAL